ncbi:MAG TPA: carboxymuconolactone decarboxylase family protein [Stellaceae bacterium]|jgi:alkylhydroperoxidase family enzyme
MQARIGNPAVVLPEAMQALLALAKATETDGVPYLTHKLVQLRASQINGCGVCVTGASWLWRRFGNCRFVTSGCC